jgi:hypothetical protein
MNTENNKLNTENNKLIAEFMGCFQDKFGFWGFENTKEYKRWHTDRFLDFTNYDSDWNSLMEVVEKIQSKCSNLGFEISARFVHIRVNNNLTISSGVKTNRIEAVYNACIEFIKWNNEFKTNIK